VGSSYLWLRMIAFRNLLDGLRAGRYLTPERVRTYSALLLMSYVVAIGGLLLTSDGLTDYAGRPIGTDFGQVWTAGLNALRGYPEQSFDIVLHHARQQEVFGPAVPVFGWHYPPFFLFIASLLALLPYLGALALWQGVTFVVYLTVIRTIAPLREALLLGAAFPAVFVNILHGHNGFLTTALLGGGLLCLPRRPLLAGLLIAALAYKPQFGSVIATVLLVGHHWRTIASASATLAFLCLASIAAFDVASWRAFTVNLAFTRVVVLEQGSTGWEKIQSAFSAIRMFGGSVDLAYAAQAALAVLVLSAVGCVWRLRCDPRLKYALVPVSSVLVTPYSLDYDLVVISLSIAFYAAWVLEKRAGCWDVALLTLAWVAPGVTRGMAATAGVPLGFFSMLLLFGLILRRAIADHHCIHVAAISTVAHEEDFT
jgi:alpha-1,2-mannosyltransferase